MVLAVLVVVPLLLLLHCRPFPVVTVGTVTAGAGLFGPPTSNKLTVEPPRPNPPGLLVVVLLRFFFVVVRVDLLVVVKVVFEIVNGSSERVVVVVTNCWAC